MSERIDIAELREALRTINTVGQFTDAWRNGSRLSMLLIEAYPVLLNRLEELEDRLERVPDDFDQLMSEGLHAAIRLQKAERLLREWWNVESLDEWDRRVKAFLGEAR